MITKKIIANSIIKHEEEELVNVDTRLIPEWKNFYFDYASMKQMIHDLLKLYETYIESCGLIKKYEETPNQTDLLNTEISLEAYTKKQLSTEEQKRTNIINLLMSIGNFYETHLETHRCEGHKDCYILEYKLFAESIKKRFENHLRYYNILVPGRKHKKSKNNPKNLKADKNNAQINDNISANISTSLNYKYNEDSDSYDDYENIAMFSNIGHIINVPRAHRKHTSRENKKLLLKNLVTKSFFKTISELINEYETRSNPDSTYTNVTDYGISYVNTNADEKSSDSLIESVRHSVSIFPPSTNIIDKNSQSNSPYFKAVSSFPVEKKKILENNEMDYKETEEQRDRSDINKTGISDVISLAPTSEETSMLTIASDGLTASYKSNNNIFSQTNSGNLCYFKSGMTLSDTFNTQDSLNRSRIKKKVLEGDSGIKTSNMSDIISSAMLAALNKPKGHNPLGTNCNENQSYEESKYGIDNSLDEISNFGDGAINGGGLNTSQDSLQNIGMIPNSATQGLFKIAGIKNDTVVPPDLLLADASVWMKLQFWNQYTDSFYKKRMIDFIHKLIEIDKTCTFLNISDSKKASRAELDLLSQAQRRNTDTLDSLELKLTYLEEMINLVNQLKPDSIPNLLKEEIDALGCNSLKIGIVGAKVVSIERIYGITDLEMFENISKQNPGNHVDLDKNKNIYNDYEIDPASILNNSACVLDPTINSAPEIADEIALKTVNENFKNSLMNHAKQKLLKNIEEASTEIPKNDKLSAKDTELLLRGLRANILELYRGCHMLWNFNAFNEDQLEKIANKHDELLPFAPKMQKKLHNQLCCFMFERDIALNGIMWRLQALYSRHFTSGDMNKGLKELRSYFQDQFGGFNGSNLPLTGSPGDENKPLISPTDVFSSVLKAHVSKSIGMGLALCLVIILLLGFSQQQFLWKDIIKFSWWESMYKIDPSACAEVVNETEMTRRLTRFLLTLSIGMVGFGLDLLVMEKWKLNYVFIFEVLPSRVITGGISWITVSLFYLALVLFCSILSVCSASVYIDPMTGIEDDSVIIPAPLPFGYLFGKFAKLLHCELWLIFPFIPILWFICKSIIFRKDRGYIGFFILSLIWKCLSAPWHRVTFPMFFFGDQVTSMGQLITDFCWIITAGYMPDYIVTGFSLIPAIVRMIQCYNRYKEKLEGNPHMWNFGKYASSLPGSFLNIKAAVDLPGAKYTLIVFKFIETIYKLYWDFVQDWALYYGGIGSRLFKKSGAINPNKNRKILRRPSVFTEPTMLFVCVFDIIFRCLWILPYLINLDTENKKFMLSTGCAIGELIRRIVWNIYRVDAEQAVNCGNYRSIRMVPMLTSSLERGRNLNQLEKERKKVQNLVTKSLKRQQTKNQEAIEATAKEPEEKIDTPKKKVVSKKDIDAIKDDTEILLLNPEDDKNNEIQFIDNLDVTKKTKLIKKKRKVIRHNVDYGA